MAEFTKVAARRTNSTNISEVVGVVARFSCKRNGISSCPHPAEMQGKMALSWKSLVEPWIFQQLQPQEMELNFLCIFFFLQVTVAMCHTVGRVHGSVQHADCSVLVLTCSLTQQSQIWVFTQRCYTSKFNLNSNAI